MKGEFLLMSVLSRGVVKSSQLSTRHFVIKERKRRPSGYRLYLRSTTKLSLPDLFMIVSVNLWDCIGFPWIYNRVHCHVLESATCYFHGGQFIIQYTQQTPQFMLAWLFFIIQNKFVILFLTFLMKFGIFTPSSSFQFCFGHG